MSGIRKRKSDAEAAEVENNAKRGRVETETKSPTSRIRYDPVMFASAGNLTHDPFEIDPTLETWVTTTLNNPQHRSSCRELMVWMLKWIDEEMYHGDLLSAFQKHNIKVHVDSVRNEIQQTKLGARDFSKLSDSHFLVVFDLSRLRQVHPPEQRYFELIRLFHRMMRKILSQTLGIEIVPVVLIEEDDANQQTEVLAIRCQQTVLCTSGPLLWGSNQEIPVIFNVPPDATVSSWPPTTFVQQDLMTPSFTLNVPVPSNRRISARFLETLNKALHVEKDEQDMKLYLEQLHPAGAKLMFYPVEPSSCINAASISALETSGYRVIDRGITYCLSQGDVKLIHSSERNPWTGRTVSGNRDQPLRFAQVSDSCQQNMWKRYFYELNGPSERDFIERESTIGNVSSYLLHKTDVVMKRQSIRHSEQVAGRRPCSAIKVYRGLHFKELPQEMSDQIEDGGTTFALLAKQPYSWTQDLEVAKMYSKKVTRSKHFELIISTILEPKDVLVDLHDGASEVRSRPGVYLVTVENLS